MIFRRRNRKKRLEELEQNITVLRLLVRAYMRRVKELEMDVAVLNASIDCLVEEKDKWKKIAYKADERRKRYVLGNMVSRG